MKALLKIILVILSIICIFIGFNKLSHTYEIAEQKYDEYVSELSVNDDNTVEIPIFAEKYFASTTVKEVIAINVCIFAFGLFLMLILIADFIRWINTWQRDNQ